MTDEQIPIDSNKPIFIKATPKEKWEAMKKRVQERTNALNAAQEESPKYEISKQDLSKVPGGGVVVGQLTPDEIRGMKDHNDALLRRAMVLREKTRRLTRERWLRGR